MSAENLDLVRRCLDAYERGDYDEALAAYDPEIEYDLRRFAPDGEVYHGHEGVVKAMTRWSSAFQAHRLKVDRLVDAGDSVVIFFRESGQGRASGAEAEHRFTGVWEIRDGKVIRVTPYRDRAEALRAAGLE